MIVAVTLDYTRPGRLHAPKETMAPGEIVLGWRFGGTETRPGLEWCQSESNSETMKSILSGKSILIVEDYPAMRKAIRDMLYTLDADTITEADNGLNAINAMSKHRFDIVLCDYNLGTGKNGQQVLEEARFRKLIPYHCIFIIVTAEQTASMVLGAMDSKPDEYLTKPFNAQQLYSRLERNMLRKDYLHSVEKEIERGNLLKAIENCDDLLARQDKRMRTQLLRLRAELAINVGEFDKARQIYLDILSQRDLPWARLGLGIVDYSQGDYVRAIAGFEALIRDNPMFMEGYDWLSRAHEALDNLTDAQDVLHKAVDLSPQSLLRQKKLAETADRNGNLELAQKAYKAAVCLGKNSVFKSCGDFANLAKVYCKSNAAVDAFNTLNDMRLEYVNSPEAELRAATLEAELHKNLGNDESAKEALDKVLALSRQLAGKIPKDLQLDVIRGCFLHNQHQQAEAMLDGLIKTHIDDDQFLDDVRRMQSSIGMDNHSEVLIQTAKRELIAINNKGVALYKQGKFKEAMQLFERAIVAMPDNKTILLNMLQIMIHDLKTTEINEDKLKRVRDLLKKAAGVGLEAHKLSILRMEFAKLLRQLAAGAES